MNESSGKTFLQLLKYARPYKFRLFFGILCGLLSGASWVGIFHYSGKVVQPFEVSPPQKETASDNRPAGSEKEGEADSSASATSPDDEAYGGKLADKLAGYFDIKKTNPDGTITWKFMLLTVIGLPLFMILRAGTRFCHRYYMRWLGLRIITDLRNQLFYHLQKQSLLFFSKANAGNLISRVTYDISILRGAIKGTLANLTEAPIVILASLGTIVYTTLQLRFAIHLLGFVILIFLIITPILILGKYVKGFTEQAMKKVSDLVTRMHTTFTGIRIVKAFNMGYPEYERFQSRSNQYFRDMKRAAKAELWMRPTIEVVGVLGICMAFILCYAAGVQLHEIMPIIVAAWAAYNPAKQLAKMNVNIQKCGAAGQRLFSILETDARLPVKENPVPLKDFQDRITFDHVSFRYEENGENVLSEVSLEIPKGQSVAIVGPTGSGKTTLASLVPRLYDPTEGAVLLNSVDLRDADLYALRSLTALITQETVLFDETVADNIAYGSPEATRDDVIEAAKAANAHQFIMEHAQGYDKFIGEGGVQLSGGQRQRLAIARAILKNAPILIMDEATSSLDTATEQLIQEAVLRLMEDRTVVAIAHRLSTIKHADKIVVLNKGVIQEKGSHSELYKRNGMYRELCDMQFS